MSKPTIMEENIKCIKELDQDLFSPVMQILGRCHNLNLRFKILECEGRKIKVKCMNCKIEDVRSTIEDVKCYFYS